MDAKEAVIGQRVSVTLGSWTGCEGAVTYATQREDRQWCVWVQLDGMGEHLFQAGSLRPLDAAAVTSGARLL